MSETKAPQKKREDIHTVSLLVANKPGVLVRIAQVFARRGFNIDALVVSATIDPKFSRMTITAQGNPETLDQIIKQTGKLVDVLHVGEHRLEESVEKELALVKIHKPSNTASLEKLMKRFHAHIVDTMGKTLIIEQTGSSDELTELESHLKKDYGIIEMVRTGKVVMAKGKGKT